MPDTLLLVEDNEDILANLYAYLEPLGYELDCARNGRAGLAMALERRFDCLILDVMLPGMDGLALCRTLREEHGQTLPVLMLTARDTVADRVLGLEAGADDYLVKPFALKELRPACAPCSDAVGCRRARLPAQSGPMPTCSSTRPNIGPNARAAPCA